MAKKYHYPNLIIGRKFKEFRFNKKSYNKEIVESIIISDFNKKFIDTYFYLS